MSMSLRQMSEPKIAIMSDQFKLEINNVKQAPEKLIFQETIFESTYYKKIC